MFAAKVIRDSIAPGGDRATSVLATFPRIVLAECITHRTLNDGSEIVVHERPFGNGFSRNAASSRAIPVPRMLASIMTSPYIPDFTVNQSGMGGPDASDQTQEEAEEIWLRARNLAVDSVVGLQQLNCHKQDVNRLIEPFAWTTLLLTGDSWAWANFFALRCDDAAHPAIRRVARMIFFAYRKSSPRNLFHGQWHLPFGVEQFSWFPPLEGSPIDPSTIPDQIQESVARCAWLSYNAHDGDGTPEKVKRTWERLTKSFPPHASPLEHQLTPMTPVMKHNPGEHRSNINGWLQLRKLLKSERCKEYNPSAETIAAWPETAELGETP